MMSNAMEVDSDASGTEGAGDPFYIGREPSPPLVAGRSGTAGPGFTRSASPPLLPPHSLLSLSLRRPSLLTGEDPAPAPAPPAPFRPPADSPIAIARAVQSARDDLSGRDSHSMQFEYDDGQRSAADGRAHVTRPIARRPNLLPKPKALAKLRNEEADTASFEVASEAMLHRMAAWSVAAKPVTRSRLSRNYQPNRFPEEADDSPQERDTPSPSESDSDMEMELSDYGGAAYRAQPGGISGAGGVSTFGSGEDGRTLWNAYRGGRTHSQQSVGSLSMWEPRTTMASPPFRESRMGHACDDQGGYGGGELPGTSPGGRQMIRELSQGSGSSYQPDQVHPHPKGQDSSHEPAEGGERAQQLSQTRSSQPGPPAAAKLPGASPKLADASPKIPGASIHDGKATPLASPAMKDVEMGFVPPTTPTLTPEAFGASPHTPQTFSAAAHASQTFSASPHTPPASIQITRKRKMDSIAFDAIKRRAVSPSLSSSPTVSSPGKVGYFTSFSPAATLAAYNLGVARPSTKDRQLVTEAGDEISRMSLS